MLTDNSFKNFDDFHLIDELVKFLLYELKIRNMTITKFSMMNLIFKIKNESGRGSELYSCLPYYWYLKPYSSEVADSFNYLKSYCSLKDDLVILKDSYLDEFKNTEILLNYPEIEDITYNILDDKKYFYTALEKDVYKNYAPFDIMYPFKFEIFDTAFNCRVLSQINCDDYVKALFVCEAKLPSDSYYNHYCVLFSELLTNIDLINDENNLENYWNVFRFPIQEMWKTFTKGVRVQFKDEIYEPYEKIWDLKFKNSLEELSIMVNKTNKFINFDLQDINYTSSQTKMIKTTIGSYLRG